MSLQRPRFGQERPAEILAGIEISARGIAPAAALAGLATPEIPVRWWIHERS
jgi:hypothetical protein